jgi:hypothetical protein
VSNNPIREKLPATSSSTDMTRAFTTHQAGIDRSLEEFSRGVQHSKQAEQDAGNATLGQLAELNRELVRVVVAQGELATTTLAATAVANKKILFWIRSAVLAALVGVAVAVMLHSVG